MKECFAAKDTVIELAKKVDELTRRTGEPHGVHVGWNNQDFPVGEIVFAEPDSISFRHLSESVQPPNTLILSNGQPFSAKVVPGHTTTFSGL